MKCDRTSADAVRADVKVDAVAKPDAADRVVAVRVKADVVAKADDREKLDAAVKLDAVKLDAGDKVDDHRIWNPSSHESWKATRTKTES